MSIHPTIASEQVASSYGYSGVTSLDVGTLEGKHPIFRANEQAWREITELYHGGSLLDSNFEHYLPQRPGEPDDLYSLRLRKRTYNNILSKGIGTLIDQLATGELNVGDADTPFWTEFRKNIDVGGVSEKEFLVNIFKELLLYGRVFVQVDKTTSELKARNLLEERALGIRPYLTTYSAPQVYDWDEDKGKLTFVKIRQEVRYRDTPFSRPVTKVIWTYITDQVVAKYEAYIDRNGSREGVAFVDPTGRFIQDYTEDLEVDPVVIRHGYGEVPVKMLSLTSETWLSNLVVHKLKEALLLENFIFDALSIGCHLQRTYKPYRDPDAMKGAYIEPCDDDLKLGNASVIRVDNYEIVEMEGTSVKVAMERLEAIQQEIFVVLAMKTVRYNQENYIASGNSKRIDFIEQQNAMVKYGQLIREFYQDLLDVISNAYPSEPRPYAHGYTSFQLDTVNEMLLLGQGLSTVQQYMPPIAIEAFSRRFSDLILDTNDPEVLAELDRQINNMDFEFPVVEVGPNGSLDPNLASVAKRKGVTNSSVDQKPANRLPGEAID